MASPQPAVRMFHRLFIANRGEVAVRIARACDELGITPVFAVSEADADAPYTQGREVVRLGPGRANQSYLDVARVVQAARQSRCTAVHPGWGFLAENPGFAALCEAHGLTFIGPPAHVMHLMGKKTPAKRAMARAGLRLIPGSDGVLASADEAKRVAEQTGFPVLVKAESGGGGRGMRIARSIDEVESAYADAGAEARAAFGDARVYMERLIEGGRHVEIQIMADRWGNVVHLGERDCTVQRNHQKLIEESPCPVLSDDRTGPNPRRPRWRQHVESATSERGRWSSFCSRTERCGFMEMNTRLQVEHCVSEVRTGLDLVHEQIRVAAGHRLRWSQDDIQTRTATPSSAASTPRTRQRRTSVPARGSSPTWSCPARVRASAWTRTCSRATASRRTTTLCCAKSSPTRIPGSRNEADKIGSIAALGELQV